MQLSLLNIVPSYLAARLKDAPSPVWGRELTLPAGGRVLVQAPSGTGKTTLIHILYGLNRDYEGTLKWDTIDARQANDELLSSVRTQKLSVIFQDMRLFPLLTAAENIELKRAQTNTVLAEKVMEWTHRLGIADKMDMPVATLSFGEQQRVSIIRALAQPFEWLLMDEPFSHLDNSNRVKAATLITERAAEQAAGLLLADLEYNEYFPYTLTLRM